MNLDSKVNYFGHVLSYYMHQDSLMWGRLNHCLTIQVVSIGAAYAAKSEILTPALLLLGALLSICFILMFNRDRQIRDAHASLMRELADSIDRETGDDVVSIFNVKVPPGGWAPVEAGKLFRLVLAIIVVLELVLALVVMIQPEKLVRL